MKQKFKRQLFWAVIILSTVSLFFSPTRPLYEGLIKNLPWVSLGVLISELALTVGFLMMLSIATPAIVRRFKKDPQEAVSILSHLKRTIENFEWSHVADRCNKSSFFWAGYILSILGAVGDGVVLILGIGRTLPLISWGLMILPFWDLSLTYIVRKGIHSGIKNHTS